MFATPTVLPPTEAAYRQKRCRALLAERCPEAGGLLVGSRLSTYYLTGALAPGLLWLPAAGAPLLLVRKGLERARLESPHTHAVPFRSYSDLPGLAAEAGTPLTPIVAIEMSGLNWSMGISLTKHLAEIRPVAGDRVLQEARSIKSAYELDIMRRAGAAHRKAMCEILPERIHPGMSELEIAHRAWEVFFSLGHSGLMRMAALGEEGFLGHVAAGENGNYPSYYNGPLGLMGLHPAAPFMGNADAVWRKGTPLALDLSFCLEGMNTDKTQLFFAGSPKNLPAEAARAQAVCEEIETRTAEALRPGAIPAELYEQSLETAARAGFTEGFMGLGGNQVSFLGHSIGLNVDERPVLARGFNAPLKAGMTIAIEPKIGLPGFGMVGTENTWEVTDTAPRCLTGPDPMIFME